MPEKEIQAPFILDTMLSEKAATPSEGENGDLVIEGLAADIGIDRQGEVFEPGVFENAIQTFLKDNPVLLYHHQNDKQIGQITELTPREDGLWMKAVVTPSPDPELAHVYNMVRRGMMRGLSVRGIFHRRSGSRKPGAGERIYNADIAEISVTPFPVNPRTLFAVTQKAFGDEGNVEEVEPAEPTPVEAAREKADKLFEQIATLEASVPGIGDIDQSADELEADQKADAPAGQRRKWAQEGIAMKDGSFPITKCGSGSYSVSAAKARLHSAKGKSESAIKAHISKRAKALGCPDQAKFDSED